MTDQSTKGFGKKMHEFWVTCKIWQTVTVTSHYRDSVLGFTLAVFYATMSAVALGYGELQYVLGVSTSSLVLFLNP